MNRASEIEGRGDTKKQWRSGDIVARMGARLGRGGWEEWEDPGD